MSHHVIKFTHKDGVELKQPESWCGDRIEGFWFVDAQHAAISAELVQCVYPCGKCAAKISEAILSTPDYIKDL